MCYMSASPGRNPFFDEYYSFLKKALLAMYLQKP